MTVDFEDIGHSKSAREMMKKLRVGKLPDGEGKRLGAGAAAKSAAGGGAAPAEGNGVLLLAMYAVPIIAIAVGLWHQFYRPVQ